MKRVIKLVFFVFLVEGLVLPATGQSLAEVARTEKDRRAKAAEGKVITQSDLQNLKGAVSTARPPASEKAAGETKPAPSAGVARKPVRDETYWRGAADQARGAEKAAENKIASQQLALNDLWNRFYREDQFNERQRLQMEIQKAREDLARSRADLAAAQQDLAKLELEARKESVPPGWLR
ncbi:MAG: hypothetical protein HY652_08250 [Acidobacteria bacterium]|nr:hypothetical protein [Acidobacteriota bacterium]